MLKVNKLSASVVVNVDDVFPVLQGTVANKFYVHNDVFRYQDEVFGDSDSEPPEGEAPRPCWTV